MCSLYLDRCRRSAVLCVASRKRLTVVRQRCLNETSPSATCGMPQHSDVLSEVEEMIQINSYS